MQRIKLNKDVRFIPAKNRVLIFSDEGRLCFEGLGITSLVGRVAPLLTRAAHRDEVVQSFPAAERDLAAKVIEGLARSGMVSEAAEGKGPAARAGGGGAETRITFVGHATLLIETGGLRVLTDPWLFVHNRQIDRRPFPVTYEDLPPLDLISISHEHGDHLNLPTLMRLPKHVPVLVPKIVEPHEHNRDLGTTLTRLGFERVICVETWEEFELPGVKITRTPCHKAWAVTEQATWLFESRALNIFCGGDMLEDEAFMRWLGESRRVDLAFLPISGYAQQIGQLAVKEFWPVEAHAQIHRDVMGIKEAVQATRWIKPRFAVGYANGGAYWYKHPEGSVTEGPAAEFVALLERENPSVTGLDLMPGDVWEHGPERIVRCETGARQGEEHPA
jgi:L-ascorbate metabolism protein UlaG (beta-lactamase superfamily)